jgi:hypothetical protein
MRLAELGTEVIIIPTTGRTVASPWWRIYQSPISNVSFHKMISSVYDKLSRQYAAKLQHEVALNDAAYGSIRIYPLLSVVKRIKDKYFSFSYKQHWMKFLENVWKREKSIDAVFLFDDILNFMTWLPKYVHNYHGVPIVGYNADVATYLWNEKSWRYSPLYNVDLHEYDSFIVNSEGVVHKLREIGPSDVRILHFGADPYLFSPLQIRKDIDVSFYGYGSTLREEAMLSMITRPSNLLGEVAFRTAGSFKLDLGLSKNLGPLSFVSMRRFCCRSKINLNITRKTFAETYCSSTSRPFELAAMQSCIVSNVCKGMNKWFEPGKEILEVKGEQEAIEVYKWLLSHDDMREKMGENARKKLRQKHTYKHRAVEFLEIVQDICSRKS